MAANGISTLPTKQARQLAKLNLAQEDRRQKQPSRPDFFLLFLLPAPYTGNTAVPENGNTGQPPQASRPWFYGNR